MSNAQYRIGIDLGTTNCVVSYLAAGETEPKLLDIPQFMADGTVRPSTRLPSAIYLLAKDEVGKIEPVLPWRGQATDLIVGHGALELGQRRSGQLIQSAKSWLSHRQVDRRQAILPWGTDSARQISPLQASTLLLEHIRKAWNHAFPKSLLEHQDVALTLPASFDEDARALTLEAARNANYGDLYLLEEPQAACYHFIRNQDNLDVLVRGKMLLVVDIGGGTTDFSLVRIGQTSRGKTTLKRVAVGNHLLLGGDNLDQALAYQLDPRQISALSASRLAALVQQTRKAKESLLSEDAPESVTLTVLGGGSRLIGGSQKFMVERAQLVEQVESGFLPMETITAEVLKSDYAVHTLGLPYENDAAFTRHLAAFLRAHENEIRNATGSAMPDVVLFNGGLFNSPLLKQRVLRQLNNWSEQPLVICDASEPNDAVAKGAAQYLRALAGESERIESGVPHSLLLKLADGQFLGLLPKGTSKEELVELDQTFSVKMGEQVQFPLYRCDDHLSCDVGELKSDEAGLHFVSNLVTELDGSSDSLSVEVNLAATMTEVGVLEVSLRSAKLNDQWTLHFGIAKAAQEQSENDQEGQLHQSMGQAEEHLVKCFSAAGQKEYPDLVKALKQDLDRLLGDRDEWSLATSRRLVDKLLAVKGGRTKSPQHERQWLQLIGFCLRPGYGAMGDEARVEQTFNATKQGPKHDQAPVWGQHWTLYRRIAGGLSVATQESLYKQFAQYYSPSGQRSRDKQKALATKSSDDMIRMVGALEKLPTERKLESIDWLSKRLKKSSEPDTAWWSVGRLASRRLLIHNEQNRLDEKVAIKLTQEALREDWKKRKQAGLAAVLMVQLTADEASQELSALRKKVSDKLRKDKCPAQWLQRLEASSSELSDFELSKLVGETLPIGLSLG
ncbi:Chaperone protein DnaK [Marinomonas gallaica]|uniref:Chaperone protein DnaK n=1 Tax=Marinomonas gallaica TaxID=1806667 RepID=A0A1C3JV83_9GAMM|nr:hsp70 family protein [Marinomonas gallaica]SBT19035.1 Chaperone protein DnaK [Marinomonas gallaica]SBT21990.1 Chaperone protein DnaK [Marinomonas gallaica]